LSRQRIRHAAASLTFEEESVFLKCPKRQKPADPRSISGTAPKAPSG
jgi:hypothetical protein